MTEDAYGVNWQLMLGSEEDELRPEITPALMFAGPQLGRTIEAREFYADVFKPSQLGAVFEYPDNTESYAKGQVMWCELQLANQWLVMNDGGTDQKFTFSEGLSLAITFRDQSEITPYGVSYLQYLKQSSADGVKINSVVADKSSRKHGRSHEHAKRIRDHDESKEDHHQRIQYIKPDRLRNYSKYHLRITRDEKRSKTLPGNPEAIVRVHDRAGRPTVRHQRQHARARASVPVAAATERASA